MSSYYSHGGPNQEDYLAYSILVTIFCCLPFGVPAIVFSAMARGKKESGDYEGASLDAEKAKNWCIAALVAGVIGIIISVMLSF